MQKNNLTINSLIKIFVCLNIFLFVSIAGRHSSAFATTYETECKLTIDVPVSATFFGCDDWYSINLESGKKAIFMIDSLLEEGQIKVQLYDENETLIQSSDLIGTGETAEIVFDVSQTGLHYLKVSGTIDGWGYYFINTHIGDNTNIEINDLVFDSSSYKMAVNDRLNTKVFAIYSDNSITDVSNQVSLESSNNQIVELDEKYILYGKASGNAIITAKFNDIIATVNVTVEDPSEAISIVSEEGIYLLELNDSQSLIIMANYSDGSSRQLQSQATYESSNPSIAVVDKFGKIQGVGIGETTIKSTYQDKTISTKVVVQGEKAPASCFIATAAFGSEFTWPVALLRHFRDQYLLSSTWGNTFVNFYYRHSPPIAAVIASSQPLKILTRLVLAPIIAVVFLIYHPVLLAIIPGLLIIFWWCKRKEQQENRLSA